MAWPWSRASVVYKFPHVVAVCGEASQALLIRQHLADFSGYVNPLGLFTECGFYIAHRHPGETRAAGLQPKLGVARTSISQTSCLPGKI